MWKTEDMEMQLFHDRYCAIADSCPAGHAKDEVNESYGTSFYSESD
jgi:hypothetical protein